MARHGRRIGIILATIAAALLTYAPVVSACNEPAIGLSRTQAGPGDNVPFSFTGTDDDATYTVSIGGQILASGSSSGPTVSGSFVMPNLGSKTEDVTVEGFVSDPAESPYGWKSPARIEYLAPVAASPTTGSQSPTTPAAGNQPSQAPSSGARGPAPTSPAAGGGPSHHPRPSEGPSHHSGQGSTRPHTVLPAGRSGGPPAGSTGSVRTSTAQRARPASPVTAPPSTPLIRSAETPAANVSAVRQPGHPRGTTADRTAAGLRTPPLTTQPRPSAATMPPLSVASGSTAVRKTSTSRNGGGQDLLIALALGLLAVGCVAGGGAAMARVLRRRRPDPPPKPVASDTPEADVPSTADGILERLDLDAELRRLLEQADHDSSTVGEAKVCVPEVTSER